MSNREIYEKIGLKIGLEVHQQLNTSTKLFCKCPTEREVANKTISYIERRLRPTRSELGEFDIAAYFEWRRGKIYKYYAPEEVSCLVETDEEPPHPINLDAIKIALAFSKAVNSIPVDEVHVMRKIVIDGSNTSGFQRTALVSLGGQIELRNGKIVRIKSICLEEDSSKKVEEEDRITVYDLDRLGIPLIEVSTEPDINSPDEAIETALTIGLMLRLTGLAKRGIGTVRQDLNISVAGGTKVEIKGVQELELLPHVIDNETMRQVKLLEIREVLRERGLKKEDLTFNPIDITDVLKNIESDFIKKLLSKQSASALGLCLHKMKGILGTEIQKGKRFGSEVADYTRFWSDVKGLIHSDELSKYDIKNEDIDKLYTALYCSKDSAFIIIVDERNKALRGLRAALDRILMAFDGVPPETRAALPDGTTRYMRPLPGSARMYPETDIPPLIITDTLLKEADQLVPPSPLSVIKTLTEEYGLSEQLAREVLLDENFLIFMEIAKQIGKSPYLKTIAWMLIQLKKALKREGYPVDNLEKHHYVSLAYHLIEGKISKEAIEEIIKYLSKNPNLSVEEAIEKLELKATDVSYAEAIIDKIVNENIEIIEEKGEKAFSIIMGKAMEILRGKVQGKIVAELVKNRIRDVIESKKK